MSSARPELIERTVDALRGAEGAIFHLYNSTSTLQRDVVFNMDRAGIIDLAVKGTELVRDITRDLGETEVTFEYSPESFTGTELDFAIEICDEVANTWGATAETARHHQFTVHGGDGRPLMYMQIRSSISVEISQIVIALS